MRSRCGGQSDARPRVSWSFTTATPSLSAIDGVLGTLQPDRRGVRRATAACSSPRRAASSRSSTTCRTPPPHVFADLRTNVYNYHDRGLLGMALHPDFPDTPYVYVLYAHDADIGGTAPKWSTPGATSDPCPTPPGADRRWLRHQRAALATDGERQRRRQAAKRCWSRTGFSSTPATPSARLVVWRGRHVVRERRRRRQLQLRRLRAGWQPPQPGRRSARRSRRRADAADGRRRSASGAGSSASAGDPVTLDGTVIRIDPLTGQAPTDNPLFTHPDPNGKRIVAYGLRNPFRITRRPGTNEIWIGDVGWSTWEEINRLVDPTDADVDNFGWPCYEGAGAPVRATTAPTSTSASSSTPPVP